MKVLFLDIDGVVNCATTTQRHRGTIGIDPYMAFLVGKITLDTGCKVVLSSTWRHWEDAREEVRKQVVDFIDITPSMPIPYSEKERLGLSSMAELCERGKEIADWLVRNPTVERYAILDDDSDMLPEQLPNFFKTSWQTGLTEEIANRVTEHLNSSIK